MSERGQSQRERKRGDPQNACAPRPWCQWVSGCARAAPQSPEKDEGVMTKDLEPRHFPSRREPETRSLTHKASSSGRRQGCRRCIRDGAGRNSSCNRSRRCQIRYRIAAATWPAGARHIYRGRVVIPLGTIRQIRSSDTVAVHRGTDRIPRRQLPAAFPSPLSALTCQCKPRETYQRNTQ